jgi:hypothetical protein
MRKLHHAALACAVGAVMLSGNALAQATAGAQCPQKERLKAIAFNRPRATARLPCRSTQFDAQRPQYGRP